MTAPTDDELLAGIRNGADLDGRTFPPLEWAVHGLIPEGFGLFTGPPKAGKSWLALGIGLAVAGGFPALGKIDTGEERPVLLLALEDGDRRLQGRCRYLLGDEIAIPALLDYQTDARPDNVLAIIAAWLRRHGAAHPLVILDTLGKVMPTAVPGEGAYQRDYRIGSALKRLTDQWPGSCLMVVHHTRKAGSDDWMDSTSGTNGLNGAADFTINLSRPRNEDGAVLRVTGRDVAEGEYAVTSDNGRWSIDGSVLADAARKAAETRAKAGLGDRSGEILDYISEQAGPVTPKQVADALDLRDARRYLARLADAGRIDRMGRGKYSQTTVPSVPMSQSVEELQVIGSHEMGHSEMAVSQSTGALTWEWDIGTDGTHTVEPSLSRPCGHPGDPATRCGTCIAEKLNREACEVCGASGRPLDHAGICDRDDHDHEIGRRSLGVAS